MGGVFDSTTLANRGAIVDDGSNRVTLRVTSSTNFAADLNIQFKTTQGDSWNLDYTYDSSNYSFNGAGGDYATVQIAHTSGSNDHKGVYGRFEASRGTQEAVGVFVAK